MTLRLAQIGVDPCGWCGLDGCITHLKITNGRHTVTSSCRYHYARMQYAAAIKYTTSTPCTNVPIHCSLCAPLPDSTPRTIWKYNALFHLLSEHPGEDGAMRAVPPKFMVDMHVSRAEERAMKVEDEMTEVWRGEYDVPGSDDVQGAVEELERDRTTNSCAQKRSRAASTVQNGKRGRKK